ncbi:MAG: universal stress protein, partial [Candidatus Magnetominusculus sp. LBB02]|nr:universal stress protein [Candidatus Magnetominusculus sp. LBB02]
MKGYRKVLIAVGNSNEVIRQGLALAAKEKSWVTIIKVLPHYNGDLDLTGVKKIEETLSSDGDKIRSEIEQFSANKLSPVKVRLEYGSPHEKILEAAEEQSCDLIVMGVHKSNRIKKLMQGNTVGKVIDNAPCPVLLVR